MMYPTVQTSGRRFWRQAACMAAAAFLLAWGQPGNAAVRGGIIVRDPGGVLQPLPPPPAQLRPLGWGGNSQGQVGNRGTLDQPWPAVIPGGPIALSAGGGHTLMLRVDHTVWAWGSNASGELGDGHFNSLPRPVQVQQASGGPLTDVVSISAGGGYSLAVKADGTVWGWGTITFPSTINGVVYGPRAVPVGCTNAVAVAAGRHHALALRRDGSVFAWGNSGFGQVGNGVKSDGLASFAPAPVRGLSGAFVAVAAGAYHSMALRSDGSVFTWGANFHGSLGDGTQSVRTLPVQVSGVVGATAIAAGYSHSLALRGDGTVRAWGENANLQLGSFEWGTLSVRPVPVRGLLQAKKISTYEGHNLAIRADGTVYAWGDNKYGQLGIGSETTPGSAGQVSGLRAAALVSAGDLFSVAVTGDGRTFSWGPNDGFGALGDGTTTAHHVLTPAPAIGVGVPVIALAAGAHHSLALLPNGTIEAWGSDEFGQLGNGNGGQDPESRDVFQHPFVRDPTGVDHLRGVIAIAGGGAHSLALAADGTVWAWGANTFGQLGNGTIVNSQLPVQVRSLVTNLALTGIVAISAGSSHSLALKSDGTVWAWGNNDFGQLGNGTTAARARAVQVIGLTGVVKIAAGGFHNLALRSDGTVSAWGHNGFGQLGTGSTAGTNQVVQVRGLFGVTAIAAGYGHSLAIVADRTVRAWGYNFYGQLGDGTRTDRPGPVKVIGLAQILAVSAGSHHSLAVVIDHTARAWGGNECGQLGDGTGIRQLIPVQPLTPEFKPSLTRVGIVAAGHLHSLAGTFPE